MMASRFGCARVCGFLQQTIRAAVWKVASITPVLGMTVCAHGTVHYHVEMLDGLGDNTLARNPQAVNDAGDVAGIARLGSVDVPVKWNSLSTTPIRLSNAISNANSIQGINSGGVIVGQINSATGLSAARWDG